MNNVVGIVSCYSTCSWADAGVAQQDFETFGHPRFGMEASPELIDYVMPFLPKFRAAVQEVRGYAEGAS